MIDQANTIKTHTFSSKSELFSGGKGHFKVGGGIYFLGDAGRRHCGVTYLKHQPENNVCTFACLYVFVFASFVILFETDVQSVSHIRLDSFVYSKPVLYVHSFFFLLVCLVVRMRVRYVGVFSQN